MSAPAHTELEQFKMITEITNIYAVAEDYREQARRTVQTCWQTIGQCRVADCFNHIQSLKTFGNFQCRSLMRFHACWQSAHTANEQPCIKWRKFAAQIWIGFGANCINELLRSGYDAGDHIAMATEIF